MLEQTALETRGQKRFGRHLESATSLQGKWKTLPVDTGREAQRWGAVRFPPAHAYSTDPPGIASLANASTES